MAREQMDSITWVTQLAILNVMLLHGASSLFNSCSGDGRHSNE